MLVREVYRVEGVRAGVNYGLNRVRFTAPVPVGGRIRAAVDLAGVTDAGTDGSTVQVHVIVTVELEGSKRPAMIAEWLTRLYR
jgi:acyl dehydratase